MDDLIDYLGSYLIGSIPIGLLVSKIFKGNKSGPLILALHFLKGASVVFMAHKLSPSDPPDMVVAGFLVLIGDQFPVFLRFKGVQNIATMVGVFTTLVLCVMEKI